MSYIGSTPTTQSFISGTDYFNGTGSQTAFTLSRTVASQNDVEAVVNNVVQQPNAGYTISGTTITFTSAPSAGTQNVYVRYLSTTTQAISPSQGTVGWSQLNTDTQQDLGISFKNRIINGAMSFWQRGTSFTNPAVAGNFYTADRWGVNRASDVTGATVSQSTDVPSGFQYSLKLQRTAGNTSTAGLFLFNSNETVNTLGLAGQSVTLSFWVKTGANYSGGAISVVANSGTGTDQRVYAYTGSTSFINTTQAITSTWTRYSFTGAVSSSATEVGFYISWTPAGTAGADDSIYVTGVQLEVGTQATTFTTAGGSYGAEFDLCRRYFERFSPSVNYQNYALGQAFSSTSAFGSFFFYPKRAAVTVAYPAASNFLIYDNTGTGRVATSINAGTLGTNAFEWSGSVASGLTAGNASGLTSNNTLNSYVNISAEL